MNIISKKWFVVLLIIIGTSSIYAQNRERFYAIDGSEWLLEKDRDRREQTLWEEIELNLQLIETDPRLQDENSKLTINSYTETYRYVASSTKKTIYLSREINRIILDENEKNIKKIKIELEKKGLNFKRTKAKNNESFLIAELCDLFDTSLIVYESYNNLVNQISEALVNGSDLNVDVDAFAEAYTLLMDKFINFEKIFTEAHKTIIED